MDSAVIVTPINLGKKLPPFRAESLQFRLHCDADRENASGEVVGEFCHFRDMSETDVSLSMHSYFVESDPQRPTVFFFNGGPGASSTPLHFQGFGPYVHVGSEGNEHNFAHNDETLLDVADLVFVDPIGTGFNRIPKAGEPGSPAERWLSPGGDAAVCAAAVRAWLKHHGKQSERVFLCGQSYGSTRVSMMSVLLEDLELAGVALVSPGLSFTALTREIGNDMLPILTMPTMAVAAHYHLAANNDMSAMDVYCAARKFALEQYAKAVHAGNDLDDETRREVAAELSAWIGLSTPVILERGLKVDAERFMTELLGNPDRRIGSLDVRSVGSTAPVTDRPTNDPALVVGRPFGRTEAYMRQVFGLDSRLPYTGLSFEVNGRWGWHSNDPIRRFYHDATRELSEALRQRPSLRVLAAAGIFDMSTPALATRHAMTRAEMPAERVEVIELPGGHTIYDTKDNRTALGERLRSLITG
ncbi:S10 family serine carboxypeptidase-like protein [Burkholderia pyrrocinia]|uniref:S10 family serine carboxypeptidase-like protein n=1 Tax=Burkholderia pyrrocinia TaxID=60550 RepID=UPI002AB20311|nr:hypothetical protein [Burkholderia pyrrocinia]